MGWPTWELQAHGSAAPAPDLAAPDDPVGARGPGCPLPRLDPLGPWCSARLTFADGARVDVLVTVSDDHITVEDVRADPPLTLDGLADLARWIDGPLDDAFRAATGQPRKSRAGLRQTGPAAGVPGGDGGAQAGTAPRRASAPGCVSASEPAGAGAGAAAAQGATHPTAEAGEAVETGGPGAGPAGATGLGHGEGVPHRTVTEPGISQPADPPGESSAIPSAEPPAEQPSDRSSGRPVPSAPSAPSASCAPSTTDASSTPTDASTPSPPSPSSTPSASAPTPAPTPPTGRARSAVLARTRAGERRKIAADAYRQAQREGGDPVQAVMRATGRNRRRSLRLIAGARDEGLLTPRHNKR
ncbi:DUF6214 family protein [Streptomyces tubercidicus]|uniref:DUF6214 family protein n=1 Tax=Streptomyces tubercidicus TaxID=47759 RepID=UPI0036AAE0BD